MEKASRPRLPLLYVISCSSFLTFSWLSHKSTR
jgi:hypothetical protein